MAEDAIALAIICKAPRDGACKTRLCPPLTAGEAAAASRCFIADLAAGIAGIGGCDGFAVYTPVGAEAAFDGLLPKGFRMLAQRGDGLGERLLHATEDLLAAGYGGVCLLNGDSPTLPADILRRAVAALREAGDRLVVGPAIDGGYYLIGLKRAHGGIFEGVAWSSSRVLAQTLARAADLALPLSLLPLWYDVDDLGSLRLLLHELFAAGNPLAVDGLAGAAAPHSRAYFAAVLRADDAAARFDCKAAIDALRQD
ncbi:MAG: TIGR04282 family arsenosugar biosynthesis glycosyltransferase [Rhodospirillales bacterium]|nr:TIGR04282 family arsenosugar biosynthesis glycosyltransferase [Rhodospirillales bacterium]